MSDLQVGVFLNKEILKQGTGEPLDSVEMHQVCGQSNQYSKMKAQIAKLEEDKAELVESLKLLASFYGGDLNDDGIDPLTCPYYSKARSLLQKHKGW